MLCLLWAAQSPFANESEELAYYMKIQIQAWLKECSADDKLRSIRQGTAVLSILEGLLPKFSPALPPTIEMVLSQNKDFDRKMKRSGLDLQKLRDENSQLRDKMKVVQKKAVEEKENFNTETARVMETLALLMGKIDTMDHSLMAVQNTTLATQAMLTELNHLRQENSLLKQENESLRLEIDQISEEQDAVLVRFETEKG